MHASREWQHATFCGACASQTAACGHAMQLRALPRAVPDPLPYCPVKPINKQHPLRPSPALDKVPVMQLNCMTVKWWTALSVCVHGLAFFPLTFAAPPTHTHTHTHTRTHIQTHTNTWFAVVVGK